MAAVNQRGRYHTLHELIFCPNRLGYLCGWIFLIICCVGNLLYINENVFNYITAEASNVLVLSDYLWQNGKIVADDFYYSTELYILYEQLIYAPLFALFSTDWHMVRVVGTAILIIILLFSFYFLCTTLSLQHEYPWLASILILPISASYGIYVLILTYYYFYVFVSMIIVGIALRFSSTENASRKPFTVFLFIAGCAIGFIEGLSGLRIFINIILPLSVAVSLLLILQPISKKPKRLLTLFAATLFTSSLFGYILNATIISDLFSFQDFGLKNWTEFSFDRLIETWNGVLSLFGYRHDVSISSKYTLINLISLAAFFVSIIALVKTLKAESSATFSHKFLAIFICCSLLILTGIYSFSNMEYKERYLIPTCIFFVPFLAFWLKALAARTSPHNNKMLHIVVLIASILCLTAMGVAGYKSTAQAGEYPYTENLALVDVVNHMRDAGYSKGYSTFPYGGRITEFSNGEIEMWVFKGYVSESGTQKMTDIRDIYQWLQSRAHIEWFPEDAFILFSQQEMDLQPYAQRFASLTPIYENDLFVVFDESTAKYLAQA